MSLAERHRRASGAVAVVVGCLTAAHGRAASPDPVLKTIEYDGKGVLHETYGDMVFTIDAIGPEEMRGPRLRVEIGGKSAFKLQLKGESGNGSAIVKVVNLGGEGPQVVFQHFTFGAHCCVVTKIATRVDGHWIAVLGESLDGEEGYTYVSDGANGAVLVGADESFLYAFAGYAGSLAPIVLQKLNGAHLTDVTRERRFRDFVRERLADMESKDAKGDRSHTNGFLGAWVATKVLLGEGPSAWARMLKTYDPHSNWQMEAPTFPESLRNHLVAHGYMSDVTDYPLPSKGATR